MEQRWAQREMHEFHRACRKLKQHHCDHCKTLWPSENATCITCKKEFEKFSIENEMVPNFELLPFDVQLAFENLTMVEEMLIAPIQPIMSVFRLPSGGLVHRGYCASFTQDIQPMCDLLPRLADNISLLVVKKKSNDLDFKEFKVNRHRVEIVLRYLCNNNQAWIKLKIKISTCNLNLLPIYGIPEGLNILEESEDVEFKKSDHGPEIKENDLEDSETDCNPSIHTLIEVDQEEQQQIDHIKQSINMPIQNVTPVNEWKQFALLSLSLPKLFPNCLGDPTIKERLISVSETECYKYLIKYSCKSAKSGELYYPFAEHPRFMFLVSDRLRRHRTIDQSTIYLKQNPGDAAMTIQDIKKVVDNREGIVSI